MRYFRSAALALLPLLALSATAQVEAVWEELTDEEAAAATGQPTIALDVKTTFPYSEFGVKLVNNHATQAVLTFNNKETEPVRVQIVGGSLWDIKADTIVRNLTAIPYNVEVPAGSEQSLTYNFATELHPQDLRLYLAALVTKGEMGFQVSAYNGTVSVVEAPLSFFDPQMIFLYVFLSACFAGTCYFIYNTWIATLFPQKKRGGKGGERAKGPSKAGKPVDSSDQAADGPATASGAKVLDESWIPPQHLKKPEAKRTGSGRASTPKSKAR
ncbi:uncharacterized protein PV09_05007 [Verruconis gallopava]|uniref:Uncharacterized protein n=1 Tax=Verruconis gallopava TaxID=253628 RepID=A0A0D2AAR7_9PEZI|nr:uncharacterized protein PV09_05007 [Verruconis gallopava]KIW03690.1 hypothetical protein PV09_05007 [Verruconis gallopava]